MTDLKLVIIKANVRAKDYFVSFFYFLYFYFPTFLLPLKVSPSWSMERKEVAQLHHFPVEYDHDHDHDHHHHDHHHHHHHHHHHDHHLVEAGRGRRSRNFITSPLIESRRILLAPWVEASVWPVWSEGKENCVKIIAKSWEGVVVCWFGEGTFI